MNALLKRLLPRAIARLEAKPDKTTQDRAILAYLKDHEERVMRL